MEHLQYFDLRFPIQIDQQIAATDQVEPRERRVAQHVVMREQHVLAQFLLDAVVRGVLREELAHAARRHVGENRIGVQAGARKGDGPFVDVGREDLERHAFGRFQRPLLQQHGERISLFAGGAADRPHANAILLAAPFDETGQDVAIEYVERLLVAEEIRDADQHVLQERLGFLRMQMEKVAVGLEIGDAVDLQAALDPPQHGRPLVMPEIVRGARAQDDHDLAQRALGGLVDQLFLALLVFIDRQVDFLRGHPGPSAVAASPRRWSRSRPCRSRWRCAACCRIPLPPAPGERDAAHFLDPRQPDGAVRACAGQHDADRARSRWASARVGKEIDGRPAYSLPADGGDAQIIVDHRRFEGGARSGRRGRKPIGVGKP